MNKWNIKNFEPYLFIIVCIANMLPILQSSFFGTMDGATHIYNSNLINSLLFSDNPLISSYFKFNPEPVPNNIGHIILAFFNYFLPSFLAEKILLVIYLLGLPLAFRALIKTINQENILFSYLIFPFTYSYVFLLGFYNFSIAIIFMLIALRYWIKNENNLSIKKTLIFFSLIIITYFSHIFVFIILLISLVTYVFYITFQQILNKELVFKSVIKDNLKKVVALLMVSIIPICLAIYYIVSRKGLTDNHFLEFNELIHDLKNIRTIISYNPNIEEVFTKKIFYVISVLLIISIYNKVNSLFEYFSQGFSLRKLVTTSFYWGMMFCVLLVLYFFMPDSDGSGGYFSVRTALFLFIFIILWLSIQKIQKWVCVIAIFSVLFLNFQINSFYSSTLKGLNEMAKSCYEVSEKIPENSVVLPLNYHNNWIAGHFFYIGLDKPVVVLDNYECEMGYFPLLWNEKDMPNAVLGDLETNEIPCLYWKTNKLNPKKIIDYVFVLGNLSTQTNDCRIESKEAILKRYSLIYKNPNCELYKFKN